MRVLAPLVLAASAVVAFNQPGNDVPLAVANQVPLQNSVDRVLLFGRDKAPRPEGARPEGARPGVFSRLRQKAGGFFKRGGRAKEPEPLMGEAMMKYMGS
ncbi:hypothetical protein AC1031_001520 [Aphanomyces cochlioides]|nr:hypothetical protein AC1031_001520 [Aphanomyces cochlioides]